MAPDLFTSAIVEVLTVNSFSLVAFVLFLSPSFVTAPEDRVVVKDLRPKGNKEALTVVLAARSGTPGHAMVILGKEDEKALVSSQVAFGFYPLEGTKPIFGPVPGNVADELARGKGTAGLTTRIIIHVDQKLYDKVEALRKEWANKKYELLASDCVTFTSEVAETLGLKLPKRQDAMLPVTYIEKMSELNK
jgi:hypothetical protein